MFYSGQFEFTICIQKSIKFESIDKFNTFYIFLFKFKPFNKLLIFIKNSFINQNPINSIKKINIDKMKMTILIPVFFILLSCVSIPDETISLSKTLGNDKRT